MTSLRPINYSTTFFSLNKKRKTEVSRTKAKSESQREAKQGKQEKSKEIPPQRHTTN